MFLAVMARQICGVEEYEAKHNRNRVAGNMKSNGGSRDRASRGCGFQKHTDANVGVALAHIRGRRAGRGRDHGNQRSANGVADVHVEQQRQHRHYHDPAAQSGQRPEKSGE